MARQDYTATAGQTVFTYTFQIFEDSEIDVYKNGVQLTLTTDYTVSNSTLPTIGGTVTLVAPASAGDAIALVQDIPIVRLIDYQTNGDWQATEVNSDFDRIYTLLVQQFIGGGGSSSTLSDRLVKFSDAVNRSTNTNLIPAPVVGNVLAWDATGDLENIAIPSIDAGQQVVAANIPSLRAAASGSSIGAVTLGGVSLNDGLQRAYYFDATSTDADNGSTIIKPNDIDSLDPGRWLDLPIGYDLITQDQMADDSVGTGQVINENITLAKLAPDVKATISPFFKSWSDGLDVTPNAGDPDQAQDISAGKILAEHGSIFLESTTSFTKQIDANWAEGTNLGGFPSGLTLSNNTWYRVFIIGKNDGSGDVDFGYDTSPTAANLLSDATDYTKYRRIGYARYLSGVLMRVRRVKKYEYETLTFSSSSFTNTAVPATDTRPMLAPPNSVAKIRCSLSLATGSVQDLLNVQVALATVGQDTTSIETVRATTEAIDSHDSDVNTTYILVDGNSEIQFNKKGNFSSINGNNYFTSAGSIGWIDDLTTA